MYSEEQKEEIFNNIFNSIENGNSLRKTLMVINFPAKTFYEWFDLSDISLIIKTIKKWQEDQ